jgi:hypothetical protein
MRILIALPLVLAVAGCNASEQLASNVGAAVEGSAGEIANTVEKAGDAIENSVRTVEDAIRRDDWVDRWNGVEGTYLVVRAGDAPGRYKLEMQYTLDDKGTFDGTGTAAGIAFTRPDGAQLLRATGGDATGLKYLAGKKDCLTVKTGEGYCRD